MRVVVVGATGNVGTSLLASLAEEAEVDSVLGLARRRPRAQFPKTEWAQADVERDELEPYFRGADAVVHLAWRIQPSRDLGELRRTNVDGSARVFQAAAGARVPALVYASSVGVYSPGPKDRAVGESWARQGVRTSFYARHKAEVERLLDRFEEEHPQIRVVRLRPALIFKREAASEVRRLFIGPFLPSPLLRRGLIPFVPDAPGLRFQGVHSLDVGEAYRLAVVRDVRGAFNVAADPVLDGAAIGRILDRPTVRVPPGLLRGAAGFTWRARLQPTPAGWVDLAFGVPIMDTSRAASELGWSPARKADEALAELIDGIRRGDGFDTPPLAPSSGGPLRSRELVSGVGAREL
jgi:nucleoside-diphosphate-sugar epimerase